MFGNPIGDRGAQIYKPGGATGLTGVTGSFIALQAIGSSSDAYNNHLSSSYAEVDVTWGNIQDTNPTEKSTVSSLKIPMGSKIMGPISSFRVEKGDVLAYLF